MCVDVSMMSAQIICQIKILKNDMKVMGQYKRKYFTILG